MRLRETVTVRTFFFLTLELLAAGLKTDSKSNVRFLKGCEKTI